MPYIGQKPADIISTAVDTVTGKFSGEVDAASLDISGNIDVDGVTNLDVTDIDGAVDMASTLAVTGIATFTDDIIIGDGKTIGSASDVDAIDISSGGIVNFTQTPTLVAKRLTNTPAFEAYLSSDTSISNLTSTKVPFDTEVFDSDNKYDNSTNYRFTPTISGKYFVYANVGVKESGFTVQQHNLEIHVNGSAYRNITNYVQTSEWAIHSNYISGILDLDGDDYVEIFTTVRQASGSPEMSGGVKVCYFGAYKLAGL